MTPWRTSLHTCITTNTNMKLIQLNALGRWYSINIPHKKCIVFMAQHTKKNALSGDITPSLPL